MKVFSQERPLRSIFVYFIVILTVVGPSAFSGQDPPLDKCTASMGALTSITAHLSLYGREKFLNFVKNNPNASRDELVQNIVATISGKKRNLSYIERIPSPNPYSHLARRSIGGRVISSGGELKIKIWNVNAEPFMPYEINLCSGISYGPRSSHNKNRTHHFRFY
jgi:hypothetical protein